MAKQNAKFGVMLVAAVIIGAGVFAFVAYTTYDAIGFGKVVNYESHATTGTTAAQTITLTYSSETKPVVTIWKGVAGATYNGTVGVAKVSWSDGDTVVVTQAGGGYPIDTTFLKFNYTGSGSAAREITMPAIVLFSVFAIVLIAGIMIRSTGSLGKGGKGGHKSFP